MFEAAAAVDAVDRCEVCRTPLVNITAFVEGIGYHSIDVDLPSGCVVASANAEHHAANCRIDRFGEQQNATAPMPA